MFSPNCIIALPAPEISIKSASVRSLMLKRLRSNISLYLKHFGLKPENAEMLSGRIVLHSNEAKQIAKALENCFGIHSIFVAQMIPFSSLEELVEKGALISSEIISFGTFAVRGKSFSKVFSSKKLEEALGREMLGKNPALKVKLVSPQREIYCLAFGKEAFFYFESEKAARGMPVGVQGRVGVLVSEKSNVRDVCSLVKDLLKSGCGVSFVCDGDFVVPKGLEEFNAFGEFRVISVASAKEQFAQNRIKAFFSAERTKKAIQLDSELVEVKPFSPLLFG